MKSRSLALLIGFSLSSYAQELPKDYQELKYAIIHMKPIEETNAYEDKANTQAMESFNRYIENLKKHEFNQIYSTPQAKDLRYNNDAQQLITCVNDFAENGTLDKLQKTLSTCRNHIDNMSKTDWDLLKEKGVEQPEEFKKSMRNELERLQREVEKYNRPDEIAIVENFLTMDEVNEENLAVIRAIDPNILSLSNDVQALLVDYYNSPNLKCPHPSTRVCW